ncbi:phosphoribosylamine--glycine ligase [Marinivivus vitaminiproducens]|uniref:phosphoribosylamine--glycine ligase n=1 Tax=Marinivivus vitaminiproducens TaxID=3035935 RepID=UPI0027A6086B|nr:phosphoribosylamine--glycine ligase [Geminicoccaceae bacterium SCSIO 64248]
MRVLVVGGGGREHALCWAMAASPLVDTLLCAPGNAGIGDVARCVDVQADDVDGLVRLARDEAIDLVVVGPEVPLVLGLVDRLEAIGVKAFGPSAAAARLEGSKAFAKAFCIRHAIPTAAYRSFGRDEAEAARAYVRGHALPLVVKADGLAAGKGVTIAATHAEAIDALDAAFSGAFGEAGSEVVVEAFMEGEEASLFALSDGANVLELGTAQDHKRAFDGDRGPNTGGMGAYSPAVIMTPGLIERAMAEIVRPTITGMAAEGSPFRGILYVGLMVTRDGPKLVEFNVRFGDPECQVILPRLMTDLGQLLQGAADGMLGHMNVRWHDRHALSVVLAARGYPGSYVRGEPIAGIGAAAADDDVLVFHAGTALDAQGRTVSAGGRVLNVTATGTDLRSARDRAYAAVARIDWPGGFCRRDIGWRALPDAR